MSERSRGGQPPGMPARPGPAVEEARGPVHEAC